MDREENTCADAGGKQQAVMCRQCHKPLQRKLLKDADISHSKQSHTLTMTVTSLGPPSSNILLQGARSGSLFAPVALVQIVEHYTYFL